jgi:hypothetical protein
MALKACRECGKQISTDAAKCPNCGAPHPTSRFSKGPRAFLWIIGGVFGLGVLSTVLSDADEPPTTAQEAAEITPAQPDQVPAAPPVDPAHAAINEWLTGWSTAQAASMRATCEKEPGCDPKKYTPEARPETSFGWNGAQDIKRNEDWAKGPRYRVVANGRALLVYLDNLKVVGVYMITSDTRTNICRDAECEPGR